MAFEINLCLKESCTGLKIIDRTGWWSTDNPFGYWDPADGTSPSPALPTLTEDGTFGYTSYSVDVYPAIQGGLDMNSDPPPTPTYTFDLLTRTHTVDATTGYVTWEFTLEELGVEYIRSGWWTVLGTAVWVDSDDQTYTYNINSTSGLLGYLQEQVDKMMLAANPQKCGGCKKGCKDPYELYLLFNPLTCWAGNCQDFAGFTTHVDYLLANVPPCEC